MFCPKCGKQIGNQDRFCRYCGAKLQGGNGNGNNNSNSKKTININVGKQPRLQSRRGDVIAAFKMLYDQGVIYSDTLQDFTRFAISHNKTGRYDIEKDIRSAFELYRNGTIYSDTLVDYVWAALKR